MKKLEESLKEWVDHQLISQEQLLPILDYENKKPQKTWILSSVFLLGSSIIAMGIISLIAANWYQIPAWVKLITDFLLLTGLAMMIVKTKNSPKYFLFDGLILLFFLLCLASIGLISQIYHTSGNFHEVLFFWTVTTLGIVIHARHILIPSIWSLAFTSAIFLWLSWDYFFQSINGPLLLILTLFFSLLTVISKIIMHEKPFTKALRWTHLSLGVLGLFYLETTHSRFFSYSSYIFSNTTLIYQLSSLFSLFLIMVIIKSHEYKKNQQALLITILLFFLMVFHLPLLEVKSHFIYGIFTVLILSLVALFQASLGNKKMFEHLLSIICIRFFFFYLEAFSGLTKTGLGLIFTGSLLLGITLLWNKYKHQLSLMAEKWINHEFKK
jgi:uncharacterized membrane protein